MKVLLDMNLSPRWRAPVERERGRNGPECGCCHCSRKTDSVGIYWGIRETALTIYIPQQFASYPKIYPTFV